MSGYQGVKFDREKIEGEKTKHAEKEEKLMEACEFLAKNGLAPEIEGGFAGNASFKTPEGIIITASGSNLGDLSSKQLVEVPSCDFERFHCKYFGDVKPSSETILHHIIYRELPDSFQAKAILHGHYNPIVHHTEELEIPETEEFQKYGTKELVEEVIKLIKENPSKAFVLKDHGFFVVGETIQEAKEKVKELYKKSEELED